MSNANLGQAAVLAVCAAVWALVLPGAAHGQLQDSGGLVEVVAIEIPTRVVDRAGRPIRDLTAKNFVVTEGKQKHEVVRVEVVDLTLTPESGGRPWSNPVRSAARRRFLFVFDLSFSSGSAITRAQEGVLEMLAADLHPSDLFGVARYSASRGVEMVLGLTSDLAQVRHAVTSLGFIDPAREVNDPLRLMQVDLATALRNDFDIGGSDASDTSAVRRFEPPVDKPEEVVLHLQDLLDEQSKTVRGEQTRPVLALAEGLEGLAAHLASIPGYKQVVFLSAGFDDSFLTGTSDQERLTRLSQATAVSDAFQVDTDELYGGGAVRSELLAMTAAFERADCSIHAVDIGGLRAGSDAREAIEGATRTQTGSNSEGGLFLMASETGGRFVRNQNNLATAMTEVLAQTSLTYVLVLEPPDLVLDGTFHPIKVEVRRGPKGVEALHRPGYFAPLPYRGRQGEVRRLEAADLVSSGEDGGPIATGVLAASFPSLTAAAEVVIWVEMYGYGLLSGSPGDKLPVELYAYAFRQDGTIADFATQAAVVDLQRHRRHVEAQGFKHVVRVALAPGSYYLRVLVRNAITGATGLKTQRIEVPDFEDTSPRLSVPLFVEPDGLWVLGWGQDVSNKSEEEFSYPLSYGQQRLVPSADPLLPRGVEVPLMLRGFGFGEPPSGLEATLEALSGGEIFGAQVALDGFEPDGEGASVWARILTGAEVPPGRYELRLSTLEGGAGPTRSAGIVVFVR